MQQPPRSKNFLPALVIAALAILGAALLIRPPQTSAPQPGALPEVQIEQVDDFPLWVMHYRGDYDLQEYLESPAQASRAPDAEKPAWACTVFAALAEPGDRLLGRNFDWQHRQTVLLFTEPAQGYASVSLVDAYYFEVGLDALDETEQASLEDAVFLPFDGMNEKGLAVGMMAVPKADSGRDPLKLTIDSLVAIRVLLDRTATVDEAVAELAKYNIDFQGGPPLHYLVADAGGHSAVIEFIDGKMNVIPNEHPWQVSTNFLLSGMDREASFRTCDRYKTATLRLEEAQGSVDMAEALGILADVSQPHTVWSVVYNLSTGEVRVVMGRDYATVHVEALSR